MNRSPEDTAGRVAVDHTVAGRAAGIDTEGTAVEEGIVAGDTLAEDTVAVEGIAGGAAGAEGIAVVDRDPNGILVS